MLIDTREGEVEAWFIAGSGASITNPGPAVVYAHGNAELIDHAAGRLASYYGMGVSVLLGEFRGYGRSKGSPSEKKIVRDFTKFYDRLIARKDVDGKRIVFHGRSLGGGVVCALSRKREPAALIVDSTFTSVAAMARQHNLPGWIVPDKYDNVDALSKLKRPVLITHGRLDRIIPVSHADALHRASVNSQLITFRCGHNDPPPPPEIRRYWSSVKAFLTKNHIIE